VTTRTGYRIWVPLIILWIVWGSTYVGIALQGQSMPPLLSNGTRLIVAGLALAGGVALSGKGRLLSITRAQLRSVGILGVGLMGVGIGTLVLAERYVPSSVAALIVSSIPLWIVLLRAASGDRPRAVTWVGIVIGLAGLGLMLLPGGSRPVTGTSMDVLLWSCAIVASSFVWAFVSFRARTFEMPSNSLVSAAYELVVGGVALTLLGLILGDRPTFSHFTVASDYAWLYMVIASVVGYGCYSYLLANAPISLLSTYAYVNPGVAVLLGFLILGEPISRSVAIGLTVVVGGVVLVVSGERRRS
jgi:drug/metabolite transporter (DMT)-like permease